jgi:hypothetical protein
VQIFIWPCYIVQSSAVWAQGNLGDRGTAEPLLQGNLFVVGSSMSEHNPRVTASI